MKHKVDLKLNYFAVEDINPLIKKEFYAAKAYVFGLGYEEYAEEKALPINPKNESPFEPLATYRVKDKKGNLDWISIYGLFAGGMLVTNEL